MKWKFFGKKPVKLQFKEEYAEWHKEKYLRTFYEGIEEKKKIREETAWFKITKLNGNPSKLEGLSRAYQQLISNGYKIKQKSYFGDLLYVDIFW